MDTTRATYSSWFRGAQIAALLLFAGVASYFFVEPNATPADATKGLWGATCACLVLLWIAVSDRWVEVDETVFRTKRLLTGRITEQPRSEVRAAIPLGLRTRRSRARRDEGAPHAAAVRIRFSGRRSMLILRASHRNFDAFLRAVTAFASEESESVGDR